LISYGYFPAFKDLGEYAFARHYTVSYLMIDSAAAVAFFAYFRNPENGGFAGAEFIAYFYGVKVYALGSDIFSVDAGTDPDGGFFGFGVGYLAAYAFNVEQADLPDRGSGMGVALYAVVFHQQSAPGLFFRNALAGAAVYRKYFTHIIIARLDQAAKRSGTQKRYLAHRARNSCSRPRRLRKPRPPRGFC